jgi:coproporphyrinogen III oxidase
MEKEKISHWFQHLQDEITTALESIDGKSKFHEDVWKRNQGGGGRSRIIQDGNVFEKGGVNFSAVHGPLPEMLKKELQGKASNLDELEFFATGVSIVMHPMNPWVPIIHMNVRYFEINDEIRWFGGGIDLTPIYVDRQDASFFHENLKNVCDSTDPAFYESFKKWADDYFFIRHRNETRGVGGIFFDKLTDEDPVKMQHYFEFVKNVGNAFVPIYTEIVNRSKEKSYSRANKKWQMMRRSRYAEFNLVYDRGTRFGLETDGRIESILMSMPPVAEWVYDFIPEGGSHEEMTIFSLKKGTDWINLF